MGVGKELPMTSTTDRWEALDQAFQAHRIPMENWPLIRRIVEHVGIDHYEGIDARRYIKAIRRDGQRMLKIAYGYTAGFRTEEEAVAAAGDVARAPSSEGGWYVLHPVNAVGKWYGGSGSKADARPAREVDCPDCGVRVRIGSECGATGRKHEGPEAEA